MMQFPHMDAILETDWSFCGTSASNLWTHQVLAFTCLNLLNDHISLKNMEDNFVKLLILGSFLDC